MNFVWDIVLNAENQEIKKKDLFFKQASIYSPWYEQSFSQLNKTEIDDSVIEINALYRFNHIFKELLHTNIKDDPSNALMQEFSEYLFDIFIHALSEVDLKHGLTKREFYVRKIRQELLAGQFGKNAMQALHTMNTKLQHEIANELLTQMQTGSTLLSFRRAMNMTFSGCFIYQSKFNCKELFVYLGRKEKDQYRKQFEFVMDAFLPLGFTAKVFWEYHFGIIGVDATMSTDNIALF